jgi:membrane-associated protein
VGLLDVVTSARLAASAAGVVAGGGPLSAQFWLSSLGAFGVFLVLVAETGLLIGVFLPGDSLLFTAGLLCSTSLGGGHGAVSGPELSLGWVLVAAVAGALIGAQVGFALGRRGGRVLLGRTRNRHVVQGIIHAEQLFFRYGHGKAIVLARFIPVVRTVINPLAGILAVPTRAFVIWQGVGGLVWALVVTLAGYGLGATIPGVDSYLLPVIAGMVAISMIPVGLEMRRTRRIAANNSGHSFSRLASLVRQSLTPDFSRAFGSGKSDQRPEKARMSDRERAR